MPSTANAVALFAALPRELQCEVLLHLDLVDRLNLIQFHPSIQLAVAGDISWFIPLLLHPDARNAAFAAIHAPVRGAREHVRQFRRRVEAHLTTFHQGGFRSSYPDPWSKPDGTHARSRANPKALARFRDLLHLLRAVDVLLRDNVVKWFYSPFDRSANPFDVMRSALEPGTEQDLDVGALLAGRGLDRGHALAADIKYREVFFQARFFELELFTRLFYSNPLKPLYSSADTSSVAHSAPRAGQMTTRDARTHGLLTRWDNPRRYALWTAEPKTPGSNGMIKASTLTSLFSRLLWIQYALWAFDHLSASELPHQLDLDDDKAKWPEVSRFLCYLTSLGLGFFRRCFDMTKEDRQIILQAKFEHIRRLPVNHVPSFGMGDLSNGIDDIVSVSDVQKDIAGHVANIASEGHIGLLTQTSFDRWTALNDIDTLLFLEQGLLLHSMRLFRHGETGAKE
ncbi:hypothetical protein C8035_v004862 [Colletotrichum spinosum]|uniref:F-box domain-containing protein n=1 Tax=Colletotrichum spinosum TaxID=1347390 RepID=A0A4V3HTJ6_9PEZI|nr:hypothetical protein C8035_v004862 [Colletotrichum spinosum]